MTPTPSPYSLVMLVALNGKPEGSVYTGSAYDRPARRRLPKRRAARRALRMARITARSSFAQRVTA